MSAAKTSVVGLILAKLFSGAPLALANDAIHHPYQSPRISALGGTRTTMGLFQENFYGNPARVTENPEWRVQLLDPTFEINSGVLANVTTIPTLVSGGASGLLSGLSSLTGRNNHIRYQMSFPSVFVPEIAGSRFSLGVGILTSLEIDLNVRASYAIDPSAILDVGPAVTLGRTFLEYDQLAVGVTAHGAYRLGVSQVVSMLDLFQGRTISASLAGDGAHFDFDVGATYILPWEFAEFEFVPSVTVSNVLSANYKNIPVHLLGSGTAPQQPRAFGLGVAARRDEVWKFTDILLAIEANDIGNNVGGGWARMLHMGAEGHFGVFAFRVGLNQGYICGGLGLNLKFFELDLATYGEEMSLNAGLLEDRRYALRISLQI